MLRASRVWLAGVAGALIGGAAVALLVQGAHGDQGAAGHRGVRPMDAGTDHTAHFFSCSFPTGEPMAPGPGIEESRSQYQSAARTYIAFFEQESAKALKARAANVASDREVDQAALNLARARLAVAILDQKADVALEQDRILIALLEKELKQMQRLRAQKAIAEAEIDTAQRRLACSRYRLALAENKPDSAVLQLRSIVETCDKDLARLQDLRGKGAASDRELTVASSRLAYARYRLAAAENRPEAATGELRLRVADYQKLFEQAQRLAARVAGSADEVEFAQIKLTKAKETLCLVEKKSEEAISQIKLLVDLEEGRLQRLRGGPSGVNAKFNLARERYRFAKITHGIPLLEDEFADELER